MALVIFILVLLILAMAGVLGLVVKVALGVAVGIFLGLVLAAWLAIRRIKRALGLTGKPPRDQWRRIPRSRVEILERPGRNRSGSPGSPSAP